jgi:hypothetical protein
MIAVVCPLVAHSVRPRRIDERVMKGELRDFESTREAVEKRVQPDDVLGGTAIAVVPRQDVRDGPSP